MSAVHFVTDAKIERRNDSCNIAMRKDGYTRTSVMIGSSEGRIWSGEDSLKLCVESCSISPTARETTNVLDCKSFLECRR